MPDHGYDLLPDGVVILNRDFTIRAMNTAAETLFGVDRDACVGRQVGDVMTLKDREGRSWSEFNQPYDGLSTRTGVPEQSWILPDGKETLVAARIIRDAPLQPPTGLAVTFRSGRGRDRLDRERSDLVAVVAHELRSPLTGVKGFVQALLNRWELLNDEQKQMMLRTVNVDADRLSRLITELLDVARLDTGRLSLYPRPTSAEVLISRVIDTIRAGAPHDIRFCAPQDLPEINADPDKFTQVVTNLIENAVRHGDGPVLVDATRVEGQVRVTIDDHGDGIAPELRRRVFTKFWTSGQRAGSGLGLYLAHALTKAHGGVVTIDDAPAGGARLVLEWPVSNEG